MTRVILLDRLSDFTRDITKNMILPVKLQKGDVEAISRPVSVYKMRLPDGKAALKKVPYILHQVITGKDIQPQGQRPESSTIVRSIFCVYSEDEEEGGMFLLNLMEQFRVELLKKCIVGNQFEIDLQAGLESMIYTEETAPYYAGEIISTWKMPSVKREVKELWE